MNSIISFFDKLEDKVRANLSHYPILYSLVGGIGVVLFWRGIWNLADDVGLSAAASFIISFVILLPTGLFVSFFIGDNIILTGLRHERKLTERVQEEIKDEGDEMKLLYAKIAALEVKIDEINGKVTKTTKKR